MLIILHINADVAQLVEHAIGNGEVSGSIPDIGSKLSKVAVLVDMVGWVI